MTELNAKNLSAGYEKKRIVTDFNLSIKPGQITVLIGPNGAGKSTILKTLSGSLREQAGCVMVDDLLLSQIKPMDRAKQMAVMMTGRAWSQYASCYDVVAVGRYPYTNIYGRLTAKDQKIIESALESVNAAEYKNFNFDKLSDGQKQRVLLARALVQEPDIMILDEPTSFLDIGYKLEFVELLRRLVKEKNIAVVMSMHELELAKYAADQVACISGDGRLDAVGKPDQILKEEYIRSLFNINTDGLRKIYRFDNEVETQTKEESIAVCASNQNRKTKYLMIQGTMSSAGKSLIAAGLCRVLKQDGYRVAPFKSQNMALNSYITEEGLEMGRAQVMQAEACGIKPSVYMNPILLKPTDDKGSQVIVNGQVLGNMQAKEYFKYKTQLLPDIKAAVKELEKTADIIVIEGAGSPAEINLKDNDIVNMGMAELVDAPVLLVADIDRGGVFAQLIGTVELLEANERARVKGLIVNKFRGDKSILDPGIDLIEEKTGIPVEGVVPYMSLKLEDEDSLTEKFHSLKNGLINIGIIRLPHISNFTDFDAFSQFKEVALTYISNPNQLEDMDILILPGTKNTIGDMIYLKESGLETAILKYVNKGGSIIGICGGYQMLGLKISDPEGMEAGGSVSGLGLLPVETIMKTKKHRRQTEGCIKNSTGFLKELEGAKFEGYEIHMGETIISQDNETEAVSEFTPEGTGYCLNNVYGTYIHGIFDRNEVSKGLIKALANKKKLDIHMEEIMDFKELKEREYDKLAEVLRETINMKALYQMLGIER